MKKIKFYLREWNYKARLVGYDYVTIIYVVILFFCVLINNIQTWFKKASFTSHDWDWFFKLPLYEEIFLSLLIIAVNILILFISLLPVLYILKVSGFNDWNNDMTRYSNKIQIFFHPKNKRITYETNRDINDWESRWKFDDINFSSIRPNFSFLNQETAYILITMLLLFEYFSLEFYFNNSIEIANLLNQGKTITIADYFGGWGFESFFNYFLRTFFERKGMFDSNFSPFERFCDFGWMVLFCQLVYRFFILPYRIKLSFKNDFNEIQNYLKKESSEMKRSCHECGEHIIIWAKKCPKCNSIQKAI